ncbi:uncharacterized protein L201_001581 [Kwoniella dendrophila CBS 6074]|uniref:Carboxylesterase type B domain-containing protein n=1 Tax=Kwoniella dendrophila CBS 6074 TaxID=1295534 RepID=A0AAX4JP84_9TREE
MLFVLLLILPLILAFPLEDLEPRKGHPDYEPDDGRDPTVKLQTDTNWCVNEITITGLYDKFIDQDLYFGIPYAQPPIGPRRFRAPEQINYITNITAQQHAPACPKHQIPLQKVIMV